jgi:hypothetical protein
MRGNCLSRIAVCAAILAAAGALHAAQLYKHVDADGKVTYTDIPLTPEEKQLEIANTARNGDGGAKLVQKKAAAQNAKGQAKGGKKGGDRAEKSGGGRDGQKKAPGNANTQAPPQPPQE